MRNPNQPKIFKPMTTKKSMQFLLLGLLWVLFSIPVITIGAATCAVYYIALKLLNDEETGNLFKQFLKGMKESFVQGLLMELISIITIGGTGAFIWWILAKSERGIPLVCLAVGICFVVLVLNIYTYPIIGRYENTFANKLRNTVALAFTYGRDTLRCTGFVAAELAIAGALFRLNIFAGCVSLLFWPALIFYTISCFMAYVFYRVENPIQYDENGDPVEAEQPEEIETENETNNEEIE